LVAFGALLVWAILAYNSTAVGRITDRFDSAVLRQVAQLRTPWLTSVADAIDSSFSFWLTTTATVALMLLLVVFKRWRHLFTLVGCMFLFQIIGQGMWRNFKRPRPFDVKTIGDWAGYSFPTPGIAVAALCSLAFAYSMVVPGRPRAIAKGIAAAFIALGSAAALYLATFHPFDIAMGIALPVALVVNGFRVFTPNEVFPVSYRRGKKAHLDVGGARGEAIQRAVQDQLGLCVIEMKPVGLAGSGGSTPLRLRVAGDPDTLLFGKLYAMSHVRADRWYKVGRTVIYGRLEDEAPFQSVRRLVQYEDYTLRLFRDIGIRTAAPFGIVELTPEREYLLVTEFFDGAKEIGEADVDDTVIDSALGLIRAMWDAGVAHRDIKPANLLVKDGEVLIIDVAFAQVRPSPWREAVDLANMMLVLAVRTDAERVYQRALRFFTPDEIAEAFAAARGIASPTQLRNAMKQDGRDLLAQFRELAPPRRPIALQRWSVKRVALILGLALGGLLVGSQIVALLTPGNSNTNDVNGKPECGTASVMVIVAQSVPSATSVPCVAALPAGWEIATVNARSGKTQFWLNSAVAGKHAVEVTLLPPEKCSVEGSTEVPSDEAGMRRFEQPEQLPPNLKVTRTYLFDGGCVTYLFAFEGGASTSLVFEADQALAFESRSDLVAEVADRTDLSLCGALAPPCSGDDP
jgi:tRNA A-37 threonylcarbamoyl transferase component Bud32